MKTLLALATFAAAATMTAHAVSAASAAPSTARTETLGFGYDLIDLNNLDGIDPTISFRYDGNAGQSYRIAGLLHPPIASTRSGYGTLAYNDGFSAASLQAGPDRIGATVRTERANVQVEGKSSTTMTFSLTPYTAVIFHVPYRLLAEPSAPGGLARASLAFNGVLGGGYDSFAVFDEQAGAGMRYGALKAELATGGSGMFGALALDAQAFVAVVPEPDAYAMLLAGLAVLGWPAWRRRRR